MKPQGSHYRCGTNGGQVGGGEAAGQMRGAGRPQGLPYLLGVGEAGVARLDDGAEVGKDGDRPLHERRHLRVDSASLGLGDFAVT